MQKLEQEDFNWGGSGANNMTCSPSESSNNPSHSLGPLNNSAACAPLRGSRSWSKEAGEGRVASVSKGGMDEPRGKRKKINCSDWAAKAESPSRFLSTQRKNWGGAGARNSWRNLWLLKTAVMSASIQTKVEELMNIHVKCVQFFSFAIQERTFLEFLLPASDCISNLTNWKESPCWMGTFVCVASEMMSLLSRRLIIASGTSMDTCSKFGSHVKGTVKIYCMCLNVCVWHPSELGELFCLKIHVNNLWSM